MPTDELQPYEHLIDESALTAPPAILLKVVHSLNSEMSTEQISEIVAHEQTLSAQIMRLANSSFFGFKGEINTIERAITILGTSMVLNIALTSFLVGQTRSLHLHNCDLNQFWLHSFLVADFAREFAHSTAEQNYDEAYLTGLLHDLGALPLYSQEQEKTDLFSKPHTAENVDEYERDNWGITSTELTYLLLKKWNLPEKITTAVADFQNDAQERTPLGACLFFANEFASLITKPYRKNQLTLQKAEQLLEKTELSWEHLIHYASNLPLVAARGRQIMDTILQNPPPRNQLLNEAQVTLISESEKSLVKAQLELSGCNVAAVSPEQSFQGRQKDDQHGTSEQVSSDIGETAAHQSENSAGTVPREHPLKRFFRQLFREHQRSPSMKDAPAGEKHEHATPSIQQQTEVCWHPIAVFDHVTPQQELPPFVQPVVVTSEADPQTTYPTLHIFFSGIELAEAISDHDEQNLPQNS